MSDSLLAVNIPIDRDLTSFTLESNNNQNSHSATSNKINECEYNT